MVSLIPNQRSRNIDIQLRNENMVLLYAAGIVNPNGPTLNCYYSTIANQPDKMYRVMLHPTTDSISEVGLVYWDLWKNRPSSVELYADFFDDSMPTLFMKGKELDAPIFQNLLKTYINHTSDVARTYTFVRNFPGDPFNRVSAEMKAATDAIRNRIQSNDLGALPESAAEPRRLDQTEADHFLRLLSEEQNMIQEIKAFLMAYTGSIENVIPPSMVTIPFPVFITILKDLCVKCGIDF